MGEDLRQAVILNTVQEAQSIARSSNEKGRDDRLGKSPHGTERIERDCP